MSVDITTSWTLAERECFSALLEVCGGIENQNAFIGYLPEDAPNVWAFSSGGNEETQIERLKGENPCFGVLRFSAQAFGQFVNRETAQQFACNVVKTLSNTGNMHNTGNVMWLTLTAMPQEPQLVATQNTGYYLWGITIPMELIFSTSVNYQEN